MTIAYAMTCVRLWKMMGKRSQITCTYRQFVLGLLYTLTQGLRKDGQVVLEPDAFLIKYLPKESVLETFRSSVGTREPYKKGAITAGCNNINHAISQCPLEDLRRAANGTNWTDSTFLEL